MENASSQEDDDMPSFFCHLCSISCASALNLQSHFLGIKHRKVEEAIRIHVTGTDKAKKPEEQMVPTDKNPNVTLQEHIDACKDSEPALGLEYVYQYRRLYYYTYECKLCECRAGLTHMFMHIVGAKHRITYLGKHHPELGICGPYIMRGPKKLKKLRDVCLKVEQEFGRKNINIVDGIDSQWGCSPDAVVPMPSEHFTPYIKVDKVDFTSDDCFNAGDKPAEATEGDKPVDAEPVVTFLELKAAYEASQKDVLSGDIEDNSAAEETLVSVQSGNIEDNSAAEEILVCVTEEDTDDTEDPVPEHPVPDTVDPVPDTADPVPDTKDPVPDTEDPDPESKNDSPEKEEHSKEPCKSDQGFRSSKELFSFLEHFSIVEEGDAKFVSTVVEMLTSALLRHRKGCKEKKLSTSDASTEQDKCKEQVPAPSNQDLENQFKTPLFPIPKAAEKRKRKFTLSPDEDQESVEKFNQEHDSNGPTTTANALSKDRESQDLENQFKTPLFPIPKAAEKRKRKFSLSPDEDQVLESVEKFNQEHDSNGPTTTANVLRKDRESQVQTVTYPATQVNIGAPVAQTRFVPPQAPFPSRPPLFPIAQQDVVSKFFDSIKNMDVNEVASTLSRITATNPAFKGINVPSLIRYLTETGKLKTQSMQQTNQ